MKTVAIAAPTGMLGSMIYNVFKSKYRLVLIYRSKSKIEKLDQVYAGVENHKAVLFDFDDIYNDYLVGFHISSISKSVERLVNKVGKVDAFINCAGIINRHSSRNPAQTFFINASLPNILSSIYKEKLIHVSTDCVFNGVEDAPYDEKSLTSPNDLYGMTKALGEAYRESLVIRTSVIGPEIANFLSLLEWFRNQNGKEVQGYTNHIWNGLTSKEFAKVCIKIIENRKKFPKNGLFHIFSTTLSKYKMLLKLKTKYKVKVKVEPVEANAIDRRLISVYSFCKKLKIPSFDEMLAEL